MEGECKVMLEVAADTEVRKQPAQGVKLSSKITTALLVFTLCLAATAAAVLVLNRHAKSSGQDEETFDLHHTLRELSGVRAAIHLEGSHNVLRKDSVEWKDQVDQSHSQGGLKLEDNEIVIPHNGLYFVYSQVSFEVSCHSSDDDEDADDDDDEDDPATSSMIHLSHTVRRWSKEYGNDDAKRTYMPILHSVRTACQKNDSYDKRSWFSAIYMGAVFNLRAGDRLRTEMEETMLLDLDETSGKNFFGVFAL